MNIDNVENGRCLDYAYGWKGARDLASGTLNRHCTDRGEKAEQATNKLRIAGDANWQRRLLCPDPNNLGQEGICDSKLSAYNADSWALVVVGGYYTKICGRQIPLPEESSSATDDSSCPAYDDSSYDADDVYGVNDYVHFGDSYAAGMGTGTITGDSCRVGSNSYGKLVQEWFDTEDFTYTNYACSGDTTVGLNKKIDQWLGQNPTGTTMATLTIGENDVFSSDLVSNCVLTMWWYSLEQYRQWCLETEEKARNLMQDTGSDGLGAKLRAAHEKILNGSGSSSFNLYIPGYVTFFNEDITDCDSTTFWYESPHYNPQQSGNYAWLTTDLRKELNDLVRMLNSLIQSTISDINTSRNTGQIHYIDMDARFDGHHWCEPGTQEPDPDNRNTSSYPHGPISRLLETRQPRARTRPRQTKLLRL